VVSEDCVWGVGSLELGIMFSALGLMHEFTLQHRVCQGTSVQIQDHVEKLSIHLTSQGRIGRDRDIEGMTITKVTSQPRY
jgi:hypothetical protein